MEQQDFPLSSEPPDLNMSDFELYTGKVKLSKLAAAKPAATLRRDAIGLNEAAVEIIGHAAAVELLYNPKRQVIALRPAKDDTMHAYRVLKSQRGTSFRIKCVNFFRQHNIDTTIPQRYLGQEYNGMLTIDLKQPGVVVSRKRDLPGGEK